MMLLDTHIHKGEQNLKDALACFVIALRDKFLTYIRFSIRNFIKESKNFSKSKNFCTPTWPGTQ